MLEKKQASISAYVFEDTALQMLADEPAPLRHFFAVGFEDRAKAEWKAKKFDIVPDDESEFIPLPE